MQPSGALTSRSTGRSTRCAAPSSAPTSSAGSVASGLTSGGTNPISTPTVGTASTQHRKISSPRLLLRRFMSYPR